jgi:guanyl-specific ribonuclease Sa
MAMMLVAIVLVLAFRYWSERNGPPAQPDATQAENAPAPNSSAKPQATPVAEKPRTPKSNATTQSAGASDSSRLVIRNVSLRNQDGRVIYRGDIALRPTLDRILAGKKLRFANDGSVFQNREGRLPT